MGQRQRVMEICGQLLEDSPDKDIRAETLLMLARGMWGFQAEEVKRRYTEAVEAAEGTDQLVYVLAEAVMVLGKSLAPVA